MLHRAARRLSASHGSVTPPAVFSPTVPQASPNFDIARFHVSSAEASLRTSPISAIPTGALRRFFSEDELASSSHAAGRASSRSLSTGGGDLVQNAKSTFKNQYEMLCAQETHNPHKLWMTLSSCSGENLVSAITGEAGTQRIAHNHGYQSNKWQASCIEVRQRHEDNPVISLRRLQFIGQNDGKKAPWEREKQDDVEVVHYFETHTEEGLAGYTNVASRVAVGELPGVCNNQTGEGFAQWIVPRRQYVDLIKTRPLLDVLRSKPAKTEEWEGRPVIQVQANVQNPYSNTSSSWQGSSADKKVRSSEIDDDELMASLEEILSTGGTIQLKKDEQDITHETSSLAAYATAFAAAQKNHDGNLFQKSEQQ